MSGLSDGAGGYTISEPLMAEIVDALQAELVLAQAGARVVRMPRGNMTAAVLASAPTASFEAELAAIDETEPTLVGREMRAKSLKATIRISRELLADGQGLEEALPWVLAQAAARSLERAVLFGAGGTEPLGIAGTAGVQSITVSDPPSTHCYEQMLQAERRLRLADAGQTTAAVMHPGTAHEIHATKDLDGAYLLPPVAQTWPTLQTTGVPVNLGFGEDETAFIVGDFRKLVIGVAPTMAVQRLNEIYAENGQIGYLLTMRVDSMLEHPESFVLIDGIVAP